jgi:hypothetical protein
MKRYAIVRNARSRSEAEAYLPENYRVIWKGDVPKLRGSDSTPLCHGYVIEGEDVAGWTFDDYVIPRYGSGLIGCEEIDLSHPVMRSIPL